MTIKQEMENDLDQFKQFYLPNISETQEEQEINTEVHLTDNCYNEYITEVEENKPLSTTTDLSMDTKLHYIENTDKCSSTTQICPQYFNKSNGSFNESCFEPTIKIELGDCDCEIKVEVEEADEH